MNYPKKKDLILKAAQFFAPDHVPQIMGHEWKLLQREDETIGHVIKLIETEKFQT